MFKFSYGVLIAATIAVALGAASAQQPSTQEAPAPDTGQSAAPAGAAVYIQNLKNGDTVTGPFKVLFGLSNMGIAPAGVEKEKTGHHHLLIDTRLSAEEMTQPIASDEQHKHFGGGQTETTVTLPPGQHTLQLVLANWSHIPFKPPVQSDVITITVQDEAAAKPVMTAEAKEAAETREANEAKEALEAKEAQEAKQALEAKQAKEAEAAKEAAQAKPAAEAKPTAETKTTTEAKSAPETKSVAEAKVETKPVAETRTATEIKPAPEAKAASKPSTETRPARTAGEGETPKRHKTLHRHHRRHHHHYHHRRHHHHHGRLHGEYMHM
jgi:chemotaxis protein histidine kinase CheA